MQRPINKLIVVLICLVAGLACPRLCLSDPMQMNLSPSGQTSGCVCHYVYVTECASDWDPSSCGVAEDGVILIPPSGWEADSPLTRGPGPFGMWCQRFKRVFNAPGVYSYTFAAQDTNTWGTEDDSDLSISVTITIKDDYTVGSPISCSIQEPTNGLAVARGQEVTCTATASDFDLHNCQSEEQTPLTYTWTTNRGSFKNGSSGQSVVWVAPATSGSSWVKVTVSSPGDSPPPRNYCGSKADPSVSRTVNLYVCNLTLRSTPGGGPDPPPPPPPSPPGTPATGGIQNDVHQVRIIAEVWPIPAAGQMVTFSIQLPSGVHIPAGLSLTPTSDRFPTLAVPLGEDGKATAVFTSSDLDQEHVRVNADFTDNHPFTTIDQVTCDYPTGGFYCDPATVPADGVTTTNIRFCLVKGGTTTPVAGHNIEFVIESIKDADGNPVAKTGTPPAFPPEYGEIVQSTAVTGADGFATGVYRVGTEPGTIYFRAEDANDQIP